jgi:phosphatidylglycerol:prolipoprotein diacylglycerol transferase
VTWRSPARSHKVETIVYPIIFQFGPITVYSFGVLMAVGFYLGASLAVAEYRRRGGDGEQMWNLLVWVFLGGLVGSKLLSVAADIDGFIGDPIGHFFSGSGFVWYGGLIGGFGTAFVLRSRYKMAMTTLLDCCALGLPIGQAIGRLGCHVAGDGDWGIVTDLPWGVAYTNAIVGWDYAAGTTVHPTPIYEAAAYTTVFLILWKLRTRQLAPGVLFSLYLVGNATARFVVEFIRINPRIALGLSQAQFIAIALFVLGLGWMVHTRRSAGAARSPAATEEAGA